MTRVAIFLLSAVAVVSAQHVRPPTIGPVGHGFGNVVFPGTGIPKPPPLPAGHIRNLGSTLRGVWPAPTPGSAGHGGGIIFPIAVPVWGGYGYGYGPQPAPQVTLVQAPQPSPSVIINQNFVPDQAKPVVRDYTSESLPAPAAPSMSSYQAPIPSNPEPAPKKAGDKPTIYLVAMNDGAVYAAYAYWIEGDTLHYVTTKHSLNRVSVTLVDAELSKTLNRERGVEFSLGGRR